MKVAHQIKLEEAAMFLLSIFAFSRLPLSWWWFPALILTPDIGMIAYIANPKLGALTYNLLHNKALGILLYGIGYYGGSIGFAMAGIIIFGHASLDRLMGYGLKYSTAFTNTHLGAIGRPKE